MVVPGWIWAVFLTIFVFFQRTVTALQLDINDERK